MRKGKADNRADKSGARSLRMQLKGQRRRGEFALTSVILGVVFIIIMVAAAPHIYTLLFSKDEVEKCRASVNIKAISLKPAAHLVDIAKLDLACHTAFLTAKEDGIYSGGNLRVNFGDGKFKGMDTTQDKLKTAVADKMKDCWYMFGKGEINPFSNLGGDHCVVCYEITFDPKVRNELPALSDFNQFLAENNAFGEVTYASYLYGSSASEVLKKDVDIDTKRAYSVVYFSHNVKLGDFFGCVVSPALCAGSFIIGNVFSNPTSDEKISMGVTLFPVEDLKGKCEKLY